MFYVFCCCWFILDLIYINQDQADVLYYMNMYVLESKQLACRKRMLRLKHWSFVSFDD